MSQLLCKEIGETQVATIKTGLLYVALSNRRTTKEYTNIEHNTIQHQDF